MGNPLDDAVISFIAAKSEQKDKYEYVSEKLVSLFNDKKYANDILEANARLFSSERFRIARQALTSIIEEINTEIGTILVNNLTIGEIKTETPIIT